MDYLIIVVKEDVMVDVCGCIDKVGGVTPPPCELVLLG